MFYNAIEYFFGQKSLFSDRLLGVIYAYCRGAHVSVYLLFRRLNARIQRFLNAITAVFILLFGLCIFLYGYKYWWLEYSRGWRHFGMLDVPMSYTRIALPIVGLILIYQVAITIYDHIKALRSVGKDRGLNGRERLG